MCRGHWTRWRRETAGPAARVCQVEGCGGLHHARGYCSTCYQRWERHGHAGHVHRAPYEIEQRILARVRFEGDCWIWTGAIQSAGYGVICIGGAFKYVHRVMWECANGPIPERHHGHHRCVTPACCNPAHVEVLTPAEHAATHRTARREAA